MPLKASPASPTKPAATKAMLDEPLDPEVLVMPPLTPAAGSYEELRRTRITLSELMAAKTPGSCISESVFDALCRHEELVFATRVRELNLEYLREVVTVVRMADSAWLVEMAKKHGTEPLKDTTIILDQKKDGVGFYDKLRREIGLGASSDKLLVPFGLVGNTHFSMGFYLPQTKEIIRADSHRPSKHEELMASYYKPFFKFVHNGALKVTSKDDRSGIEQQPGGADANACGFAASLFLSKALTLLLEIAEQASEPMTLPTLGAALSGALHEMTTSASSYKARRRVGKHDLSRLAIEYKEIRAAREKAKAEGASAKPAVGTTAKPTAKPAASAAKPAASTAKPAASMAADDDEIYNSSVSSPFYKSSVDDLSPSSDDPLAELIDSKRKRGEKTTAMKVSPPTWSRLALT